MALVQRVTGAGSAVAGSPYASSTSLPAAPAGPGARAKILASQYDLSSFSFFQRGSYVDGVLRPSASRCSKRSAQWENIHSVSEFLGFFIKTVVERTSPGTRQQISEDGG
jgi:hypothetical protein